MTASTPPTATSPDQAWAAGSASAQEEARIEAFLLEGVSGPWAVMDLVIAGAHGLELTLPERHAIAATVAARATPRTAQQVA